LKISFARRVDHSKSRTLCCFGFRSATIGGNRGLGPLLHVLCARSFGIRIRLKTAQLNTNNQSTFASPRSFTFFTGPICFSHPNGFSTNHRLLKLIAYRHYTQNPLRRGQMSVMAIFRQLTWIGSQLTRG